MLCIDENSGIKNIISYTDRLNIDGLQVARQYS